MKNLVSKDNVFDRPGFEAVQVNNDRLDIRASSLNMEEVGAESIFLFLS